MPAVLAGIAKLCVMSTGMNSALIEDQFTNFPDIFNSNDQENEPDLGLYDRIFVCHFYTYVWLMTLCSTDYV